MSIYEKYIIHIWVGPDIHMEVWTDKETDTNCIVIKNFGIIPCFAPKAKIPPPPSLFLIFFIGDVLFFFFFF